MNAGAAAISTAAIAEAIKASGAIVRVEPREFMLLMRRQEYPLVVHATGGLIKTNYQYLMSYKGLVFYTKSAEALSLSGTAEVIVARSIWIPGI